MATVKPSNKHSNAPEQSGGWRRRGSQKVRSGTTVVARGEPHLWLTAGALAVAIFMIVGLISLIVVMGCRTFWPGHLTRIELNDGTAYLGEIVSQERILLPESRLSQLSEFERKAAEKRVTENGDIDVERTLLRIDNKELTGETNIWINDLAEVKNSRSEPDWAMMLERRSWGRFLGISESFQVERPRPISGLEDQIARVIRFVETHATSASESDQQILSAAVVSLNAQLDEQRSAGVESFLQNLKAEDGVRSKRLLKLESGEEVPLKDLPRDAHVVSVRELFEGSEMAWNAFRDFHPVILQRQKQIRSIDHDGLGRLSDELDGARMATIRAGLRLNQALEPIALSLAEQDANREMLESELEERRQIIAAFTRRFGAESAETLAIQAVNKHLDAATQSQISEIEARIDEIELTIPVGGAEAISAYRATAKTIRGQMADLTQQMTELQEENSGFTWNLLTASGQTQPVSVAEIVRAFPANQLGWGGRLAVYLDRWREFLFEEPREANMEGGVFPAIWGTVAMTLIMTIAVVPFGVLAALYLREYAKAGPIVSAVRIAVNNLAGVPSIVFGVFGLGFFCYIVGARVDQIFYPEYVAQNKPVFETGGLLWASLTLALLTLPVVIVATEEALAGVPNSMREGSYGCGASKWQTIWRIVLPQAMPGIMTGMILAMARGAGEVAPLMLVGAVKIAPALPVDLTAPFLHPSRSFMHLGFHIYDLGFQSPDSEAAKPMVFTTTFLLIAIVGLLNVAAIVIRGRLRKRFASSQF